MKGAYILAATHFSPFDVPLLVRHSHRKLDFVSIVEVFAKPFVGWFYGNMNAFPLDRSKTDSKTVRIIRDRLRRGRVIAIFPEGNLRKWEDSVLNGGEIKPGIARLAQMVGVPIIPVVVLDSQKYGSWKSWLPLRRTKYCINFGEPIQVGGRASSFAETINTTDSANGDVRPPVLDVRDAATVEAELKAAFLKLHQELIEHKNELRLPNKEQLP